MSQVIDPEQPSKYALVAGGGNTEKFADGSLGIADAVAVEESVLHQKESFCFCCCDFRRAVIIVDSIQLAGLALNLLAIPVLAAGLVQQGFNEGFATAGVTLMVLGGIGLLASGIYGAAKYQQWGVIAGGVYNFLKTMQEFWSLFAVLMFPDQYKEVYNAAYANADIDGSDVSAADFENTMVGSMVGGAFIAIVLQCFFLHAHVKLYRLMKQGVMTPQNYRNVSSCCCG